MGLQKAVSSQRYLRVGIYGPSGSGKTMTALMCGEVLAAIEKARIGMWDSEHGADFYTQAVKTRTCHPAAFDFDADYDKSLSGVTRLVRGWDGKVHRVAIIDSMTHVWQAAIDSYQGEKLRGGQLPIYAWGQIKPRYRAVMDTLQNLPAHVFIIGREGVEYGEDEKGEEGVIGKKMKAEAETGYEMNMLIRMERVGSLKRGGQPEVRAIIEKDRTGIQQGKVIKNPTFETLIKPVMVMLTASKHGKIQTQEEIQRKDAGEFAEQDHDKATKSAELSLELRKAINGALDKKALLVIGKRIKDVQVDMISADVSIIRHMYQETLDQMKKEEDPSTGRERVLTALEPVVMDWSPEQMEDFCKRHLDGRTPGWPDGFSNGDLRLLKAAIQSNPAEVAEMIESA